MALDEERINRNVQALKDAGLDAIACALPMNVLLVSGYWPVIGVSIAVFTSSGSVGLAVPEDELQLARTGRADEIVTFTVGSLDELKTTEEAIEKPLKELAARLGSGKGKIGFEEHAVNEPVSYVGMNLYGASMNSLLRSAMPAAGIVPAGDVLTRLRSTLTSSEIERVKTACEIGSEAFQHGATTICAGLPETKIAQGFRSKLSVLGQEVEGAPRADGFVYCMSGKNSFEASAAFQRSRQRKLRSGDLVLVHCNSYVDGFWTDITRTYCMDEPDGKRQQMYDAVFDASRAAMEEIRPGAKAKNVDSAARGVLEERGFGSKFVHGLGHAVGFVAIDHNAPPRLHPASPDVLEVGMVLNVEPAIYIRNYGGLRHCDMVAVTKNGPMLLTDFQRATEELVIM